MRNSKIAETETNHRNDLMSYISDEYKGLNGIRPRWINFDSMTTAELESMSDDIEAQVIASIEETKAFEIQENQMIADLCVDLGIDRETYDRWMKDAS